MADPEGAPPIAPALLGQDGEKQVSPEELRRSVIERPEQLGQGPPVGAGGLIWFVASAADEMAPWGQRPKLRDQQLRAFIPTESLFSSALGVVCSRNSAFSWELTGPERTKAAVQSVLENANMGEGWVDFISKVSQDLYCQDSGAFIEIVRAGDRPDSPVIGLNHLDAARCHHTGDPQRPVVYADRLGRYHVLNWWNVVTLAELPTPVEGLYGMQICALSRLLLAAQITKNIATFKREKTGGRHTRAIHLVKGYTTQQLNDALEQMRVYADAAGLVRYVNPILLGAFDRDIDIDVKTIELASLPDGFSEENEFKHYISQIAMAFLSDYQDFAPLPGGGLGTSMQSQVLHQKSRGKGPGLFMKLLGHALNFRILPRNVEFRWQEQDIEADRAEVEMAKLRAEERAARIESGEITAAEARQLAVDAGDLPQELFEAGGIPDATADQTITDEEKPEPTGGPVVADDEKEVQQASRPAPFWQRSGGLQSGG